MHRKTALITGCSEGGLGAALAEAFEQAGFHVFATARDTSKVAKTLIDKAHVSILRLDVTSPDSVATCLGQIRDLTDGRLDVLVNNAGGGFIMPLLHTPLSEAKALYEVNVWGVLAMAQAFAPLLVKTGGAMVNISSIGGTNPVPWQGIYNSSKAAVTFLSETLKMELEPLGVRVLTAMVGSVKTEIYSRRELKLPSDSWYRSIEDIMARQARGELQKPTNEPASVTARNIVQDTLSAREGKIWRGGKAGMASITSWLMPAALTRYIIEKPRGLSQLRQFLHGKQPLRA